MSDTNQQLRQAVDKLARTLDLPLHHGPTLATLALVLEVRELRLMLRDTLQEIAPALEPKE